MLRIARSILFIFLLKLSLPLYAALPELSSIEPIEFDEEAQRLVARGDARLDFDGTRLQADRITYYQEFGLADADGNVQINREGYRLLAERATYDTQESIFSVNLFRSGEWPFYLSGVTAGGTIDASTVEGATVYYGNPGPATVNVSAETVTYLGEDVDAVKLEKTTFRVGKYPVFYLPQYTHYIDQAPYYLKVDGGYSSDLGLHLQTTTLFPVTPWLRAGLNLDGYTERGFLIGPTAQYLYNAENHSIQGALNTGYINDDGDTGEDVLNRSIGQDRGFVEWRHKHHIGDEITLTASTGYWSDSEVTRDFRDDIYDENRVPDNFIEGVYAGDNFLLSAFARFRPNDFDLVQERLPEVRLDVLPTPVFSTGAYQSGSVAYARLSEDFDDNIPAIGSESESDRFDINYRIERPIAVTDWLTLTPLAGARITHYENQKAEFSFDGLDPSLTPLDDDSFTREIYEFGFDLEARAYAIYPTLNRTWDIDGLRHVVRPVVSYRYYTDPDDEGEIAAIDRNAFDTNRPILDLNEIRSTDQIEQEHLVRVGLENLFQTRASGEGSYGSRTLAALNFYQDVVFDEGRRIDDRTKEEDTLSATWVEFMLSPAPWLKFDIATRLRTETMTLEEMRTRTRLISGEIWEVGLSSDMLNDKIDQYRIDFLYRLTERHSLLIDSVVDGRSGSALRSRVGLRTRLGGAWELVYALTFREDSERESDVEFNIALRLLAL